MKAGNISLIFKLLLFGITALITCVIVWVALMASNEAKKISLGAIDQMTDINNDLTDSNIMMYDGNEVYGSDVINCIKKILGDYSSAETSPVYVYVKTTTMTNTYTNNAYVPNIKNFTDIHYIKPTAVFIGDVAENTNDMIIGVRFTQK